MGLLQIRVNDQEEPLIGTLRRVSWTVDALAAKVVQGCLAIAMVGGASTQADGAVGRGTAETAEPVWWVTLAAGAQAVTEFDGLRLAPERRYAVVVTLVDETGQTWRDTAEFFTGTTWDEAAWVTCAADPTEAEGEFLFSRTVQPEKPVASALLYASARGLYEFYADGEKIGADLLTPGWTSYSHAIQYQVYDVTAALAGGGPVRLDARLANGWYLGMLTWDKHPHFYGDEKSLIAKLVVTYTDGTRAVVATDETWLTAPGPIVSSELYDGEVIDGRQANADFLTRGDRTGWQAATVVEADKAVLTPQRDQPCQVTETVGVQRVFTSPNGAVTLDFGQNLVGRVRVDLAHLLPAGETALSLHHAEVLDPAGNAYFGNLRKAKQLLVLPHATPNDGAAWTHFTFQGFRYVVVEANRPLVLDPRAFSAEVVQTAMPRTGYFTCNDMMLNRLFDNIVWGQRGNFVDVPTDCPQRDERLGWTGDTQVFASTGLFNFDSAAFYRKWLADLASDQLENGGVPAVIPDVITPLSPETNSSAAWGDAAVIVPWQVFLFTGDRTVLEDQYESMAAWIAFNNQAGPTPYTGNQGFHYGDWVALDVPGSNFGATPHPYLACCFHRYTTEIMRQTARELGRTDDAAGYADLRDGIDDYFQKTYCDGDESTVQTQTAQVLALKMMRLSEGQRAAIAKRLNSLVVNNNTHLNTGFVGTPYLLEALSENGYPETAVALLRQEDFPSWLYSVRQGATTIWEHWDGIRQDGTLWSDTMNSFNHYAFGAVGDWIYRHLVGIDQMIGLSGFTQVQVAPLIKASGLRDVSGSYQSVAGKIAVAWANQDGAVVMRVQIPTGCHAEIVLFDARPGSLDRGLGSRDTYDEAAGAYHLHVEGGTAVTLNYALR
ncbi:family 78 glycoside hydrolase catalytic domain [Lacticaseibacillus mingshuiensis]|uniref:family 78 glycoside hydrolase catalytic domain n=1 Tax=Lacticaseibacillus mingshuiensis TaxID=2799574 RepID=UPI001CEDEE2E|nr:family 78 glycoside hydrolase catalytic domain [Lacticaseibacillus mingshuiensis]